MNTQTQFTKTYIQRSRHGDEVELPFKAIQFQYAAFFCDDKGIPLDEAQRKVDHWNEVANGAGIYSYRLP